MLTAEQSKKYSHTNDLSHCLTPLLHALKWSGDNSHIKEATPYPPGAMDLIGLLNTMANLKFSSTSIESSLNEIQDQMFPCLYTNAKQNVIIFLSRSEDNYLVYDATKKEYTEFDRKDNLKGTFYFFNSMRSDESSLLRPQKNWFFKLFVSFKKTIWLCFGISLIISLLNLATPLIIMFVFDQIQIQGSNFRLLMIAVGVIGYLCAETTFRILRDHISQYIGARIGNLVGNQIIRRILYMSPTMTRSATVSAQISRVKEFENIRDFFTGPALTTLFDLVMISVLLIGMWFIGGELVYIPIIGIVSFIIFGSLIRSVIKKLSYDSSYNASSMQELLMEMLVHLRFIKTAGATDAWYNRIKKISEQSTLNSLDSIRINNLISNFSHFVVGTAGLATMYFGVRLAFENELSMGALMAVLLLTWRTLAPMKSCFSVIAQFEGVQRSIQQIDRFMNLQLEDKSGEEQSLQNKFKGDIVFTRVSLKYDSSQNPALFNVSFKIRSGDTLLICGHGGSGRSSILKLLVNMVEQQSGDIILDNLNLRQIDPMLLRWSVAYTAPVTQFFDGTLRENLLFANPIATDEEIFQALGHADLIDEVAGLPKGLDSHISHNSLEQFSESFRKRFGIAQTFVRKAPILLFDKPDLGLAMNRIQTFTKLLNRHYKKSTTLIVSNKRDFFRIADHVIWMEGGRIKIFNTPKYVETRFYGEGK